MKKLLVLLLCCLPLSLKAQVVIDDSNFVIDDHLKDTINGEIIYQVVEEEPEFPGGMKALAMYCRQNMQYPETARDLKIQGRILVKFSIMKDGSVSNAHVVRSLGDQSLDEEAIRLVKAMPKWKPGRHRGKVVNCWYTIPVVFKLSEE